MNANHPIRMWREANKIRQGDFARLIGVDRTTLASYETGRRKPKWDVLERIRAATHGAVTPNDFLPAFLGGNAPLPDPPPQGGREEQGAAE